MKRILLLLLICIFFSTYSWSQTTLAQESFESPSGDYGFTSNAGGACPDFWLRVTSNPSCFGGANLDPSADGNAWFASEDQDGGTGSSEALITMNAVTVTNYSSLHVKIALGDARAGQLKFETTDQMYIEYNMDGGGWNTFGLLRGAAPYTDIFTASDLTVDSDNNPNTPTTTLSGATVPGSFTDFTFNIPVTGNSLQVRVRWKQNGGTEEFGVDNIRVLGTFSTNVAPVLANIEGSAISYAEGDPATNVTTTITVSDTDDTNMESATVSITAGHDASEDVLAATTSGGISASFSPGTGVLTLSGSSTKANYQTVLRSVTYQNTDAADASDATRTIQFQVNDGTDNSNFQTRNITISTSVNPPAALPVCESFETNGEGTRYTSNTFNDYSPNCDFFIRTNSQHTCHAESVTGINGGYFWASEDVKGGSNGNVAGTVTLSPLIATGSADFTVGVLLGVSNNSGGTRFEWADAILIQYNFDGSAWTTVGAFYGDAQFGGHIREDANLDGIADPAGTFLSATGQYFTYNFNGSGTDLNVRIVIDQLGGTEEVVFDSICVTGASAQVAPVLAAVEGTTLMITEGDAATAITSTLTVSDSDDTHIDSAFVNICENFVSSEDVLAFVNTSNITATFNLATGRLKLTGYDTKAAYQAALRAVTY